MSGLTPLAHWLTSSTPQTVAHRASEIIERELFCARVSAWMEALRARPGERFAVYHADSSEFLAILLALWQLGRVACVAGDNQPATIAAVLPANPSRANAAAAVQFGTAATSPNSAPKALVDLRLVLTLFISLS